LVAEYKYFNKKASIIYIENDCYWNWKYKTMLNRKAVYDSAL